MGSVNKADLEQKLLEAANILSQAYSQPHDQLILQLDRVGKLLLKVDQSPSESMLKALSPILKAMVEDKLLRNQNEVVRVTVASCISEITRITAPEAPYDDGLMKEVFRLIVNSFENLSDNSDPLYSKRTSILETVAKVRSCVVMLDLDCDDLIVTMFKHFLEAIRDHHPVDVFSNMENIMTLMLDESEDIELTLISPILDSLKKDSQVVQPIARKLAENVIVKCEAKVKPCILEAKNARKFSFDDFWPIISTICTEANHIQHDNHKSPGDLAEEGMADGATSGVTTQGDEKKLTVQSYDETPQGQVTKESAAETDDGEDHNVTIESNPGGDDTVPVGTGPDEDNSVPVETGPDEDNSVPVETGPDEDNSVPVETGPGEDKIAQVEPSLEKEHSDVVENGPVEDLSGHATPSKSAAEIENGEKPEYATEEGQSQDADVEGEAEAETKNILASPYVEKVSGDTETEAEVEQSKELESEPENVFSPASSGNALNEGGPRKGGRPKKKNRSSRKTSASDDMAAKKAAESTKDSEVKLQGRSGKNATSEKDPVSVKTATVDGESESDTDYSLVKKLGKKEDITKQGEGSSRKKDAVSLAKPSKVGKTDSPLEETPKTSSKRKRTPTAVNEVVPLPKSSKVVKDDSPVEQTPTTISKRKRTPTTAKATDAQKHGVSLVGTRIKVWWPIDEMFYDGVVDSFDPKNKKHKVMYTDGDVEELDLNKEKWEPAEDGEGETNGSADTPLEIPKRKKAKAGSEPVATKGKTADSRDVATSSSRSKGTGKRTSKDDGKVTPKSSAKAKSKSNGEESDKPKPSVKFKMGSPSNTVTKSTPKAVTKDSPKIAAKDSGSKSNTSKANKVKSKSKEIEENEESPVKGGKGKSAETSKGKKTKGTSGKKRRRS